MKRTDAQNRALNLYCQMLADALNDAGYDMKTFLTKFEYRLPVPWTQKSVKETLWRPIQKAMFDKQSTTDMDTIEPNEVYTALSKAIAEKTGVHVEWPTREIPDGYHHADREA